MTTLIVLFNLRNGADASAYETWAQTTDLPIVRKLGSVASFRVFRASGLFGSEDAPPYQYIEVLELHDLDGLVQDVGSDTMQRVAAEFREFADNPTFIVTEELG